MMVEHGVYQATSSYHPYPPPLATYEDVVGSRELFMDTLKKLHASMATKFMIPIVGGKNLDLYSLFVEVTSRGGIAKVLKDRKWKEVTAVFEFPSSATNASFILRKYYVSLLYHYEQIYFFKAKCWAPSPTAMAHGLPECVPTVRQKSQMASPQQKENTSTSMPEVSLPPSAGSTVCGVIDGKFDGGYLVTVKIGSEEFKGVLYQVPNNEAQIFPSQTQTESAQFKKPRRKRRKKSEIRKRDPAHPKPNRSGYNFFFAEQHARLKPHYQGKDREISRIIGESWNKLQEPERAVYQEKALKDKERYKIEMEDYRERLRTAQIIKDATPVGQNPQVAQVNLTDVNSNAQFEGEDEMSSDKSNLEEYESGDKDSDFEEEHLEGDMELKNVNIEVMADEAFDLQTRMDKNGGDGVRDESTGVALGEDGMSVSVPVEEGEEPPSSTNANESVQSL